MNTASLETDSNNTADSRPERTRRLSAVMFTDMVGYSALLQSDEAAGLELLDEHCELLRKIFPRFSGREVDTAGDSFFVEFASALDATRCAIEIQKTLHDRNSSQPDALPIVIRIGLHLGDVVATGHQVHGDGVNIAARMEPLARPGSICMSEDVARQVQNKIDLPLAPLGRKQLKNIKLSMNAYRVVMPWEEPVKAASGLTVETAKSAPPIRRWAIAVVGLVAVVAFVIARFLGSGEPSAPASSAVSESVVAVLPFTVQGNSELDYLGRGLVDLLSTKLDGVGKMRTVDPRAVFGLVEQSAKSTFDPAAASDVAMQLGAGSFVLGNLVEVGGHLQIDAGIYASPSSKVVQQGTVEGSTSEIFSLVDGLAAQLVIVDRTGPGVSVERLEAVTTTSFSALKSYLDGLSAFRNARFQRAADLFTEAVEEDSTFALAWYQLSATWDWLFDPIPGLEASAAAMRHRDRLSERGRRLVDAQYVTKRGSYREALQMYRGIISSFPDDVEAWYQLGELQFHTGPIHGASAAESLVDWERMLFYEPDQITALVHAARIYLAMNDRVRIDSISNRVSRIEPAAERNLELLAHQSLEKPGDIPTGELDNRLRNADDDQLIEVIWSLGSFRDRPEYAEAVIPYATDVSRPAEVRGVGHAIQAHLFAGRGQFESAERELGRAEAIGYDLVPMHRAVIAMLPFRTMPRSRLEQTIAMLESWVPKLTADAQPGRTIWLKANDGIQEHIKRYLLGILYAKTGDMEAAERQAKWLDRATVPQPVGSLASDFAKAVRAEILINKGDRPGAIEILNSAERRIWYQSSLSSPVLTHARERYVTGELESEVGQLPAALESLGYFEMFSPYHWPFRSAAYLERARIFESLDENESAARSYRAFLALYSDADPECEPWISEARQRLAAVTEGS